MSTKHKIYIILLVFIVLSAALAFFALSPVLSQTKTASKNLALQRNSLNLFQSKLAALKDFQAKQTILQQHQQRIEQGFVEPSAPVKFIEFLEAEATRIGIDLEISASAASAALAKEKEAGSQFSLGFRVTVKGAFSQCLQFLERLEQSSWFTDISQVQVMRVSEGAKGGKLPEEAELGDVSLVVHLKAFSPAILSQ